MVVPNMATKNSIHKTVSMLARRVDQPPLRPNNFWKLVLMVFWKLVGCYVSYL